MKHLLLPLVLFSVWSVSAQKEDKNIVDARKRLENDLAAFSKNLVNQPLPKTVNELIAKADDPYELYVVSTALYPIDAYKSLDLMREAYEQEKTNPLFALERAIREHRRGLYENAIPYYLQYSNAFPEDLRVHVWLSECYIRTKQYESAIESWKKGGNHPSAAAAICTIHQKSDLVDWRSEVLDNIGQSMTEYTYLLIFVDLNWEPDWWTETPQLEFLEHDLSFIRGRYGDTASCYTMVRDYATIKQLALKGAPKERVQAAFKQAGWIIDGLPFPSNGNVCMDLTEIAIQYGLVTETALLKREEDLFALAYRMGDGEFFRIAANLENNVNGSVDPDLNKVGWQQARDVWFLTSYFTGIKDVRSDNSELKEALKLFPRYTWLRILQIKLLEEEGKPIPQEFLIETIELEYTGLLSSTSRNCDGLHYLYKLLIDSL